MYNSENLEYGVPGYRPVSSQADTSRAPSRQETMEERENRKAKSKHRGGEVHSKRDVEDAFRAFDGPFEGRESEQNWSLREKAIDKMRDLTRGNAPIDYPLVFQACIKHALDGILKGANSLRTTLSTHACLLISELATAMKSNLDPMLEILLSSVIKLCSATKKITSSNANTVVESIFANCTYQVRTLHHVWAAVQDKNVQPREYASGWLIVILKTHSGQKGHIDASGGLDLLDKSIRRGLADANPAVRERMRSAYWIFNKMWSARGGAILNDLDPKSQRLLLKDADEKSGGMTMASSILSDAGHSLNPKASKSSLRDAIIARKKAAGTQGPPRPQSSMSQHSEPSVAIRSEIQSLRTSKSKPNLGSRTPTVSSNSRPLTGLKITDLSAATASDVEDGHFRARVGPIRPPMRPKPSEHQLREAARTAERPQRSENDRPMGRDAPPPMPRDRLDDRDRTLELEKKQARDQRKEGERGGAHQGDHYSIHQQGQHNHPHAGSQVPPVPSMSSRAILGARTNMPPPENTRSYHKLPTPDDANAMRTQRSKHSKQPSAEISNPRLHRSPKKTSVDESRDISNNRRQSPRDLAYLPDEVKLPLRTAPEYLRNKAALFEQLRPSGLSEDAAPQPMHKVVRSRRPITPESAEIYVDKSPGQAAEIRSQSELVSQHPATSSNAENYESVVIPMEDLGLFDEKTHIDRQQISTSSLPQVLSSPKKRPILKDTQDSGVFSTSPVKGELLEHKQSVRLTPAKRLPSGPRPQPPSPMKSLTMSKAPEPVQPSQTRSTDVTSSDRLSDTHHQASQQSSPPNVENPSTKVMTQQEPASPSPLSPKATMAATTTLHSYLTSGLTRIQARKIDVHMFRRLQELIEKHPERQPLASRSAQQSSNQQSAQHLWDGPEGSELFTALLRALSDYLILSNPSQLEPSPSLDLRTAALNTIKLMEGTQRAMMAQYNRAGPVLRAVVRASNFARQQTRLATSIRKVCLVLVGRYDREECVEALVDGLLEALARDPRHEIEGSEGYCLGIQLLTQLLETRPAPPTAALSPASMAHDKDAKQFKGHKRAATSQSATGLQLSDPVREKLDTFITTAMSIREFGGVKRDLFEFYVRVGSSVSGSSSSSSSPYPNGHGSGGPAGITSSLSAFEKGLACMGESDRALLAYYMERRGQEVRGQAGSAERGFGRGRNAGLGGGAGGNGGGALVSNGTA